MFHMYDKNLYKRDVTCSWPPPPCHKLSHPLERDVLYGRPHIGLCYIRFETVKTGKTRENTSDDLKNGIRSALTTVPLNVALSGFVLVYCTVERMLIAQLLQEQRTCHETRFWPSSGRRQIAVHV